MLSGGWRGPRVAVLLLLLGVLVGGVDGARAQSQSQQVTIGVDQDTYFALSDGPTLTLDALDTFKEATASYTFENNLCGQGNDNPSGEECWKVKAKIEDGDAPTGITLEAEMEAPPTEKPNFNTPTSRGRKTLSETDEVRLLEDIGNTEQQGLDITYWAKASPEADPSEHVITVVYTLSQ